MQVAREHPRGVGDRLAAAELQLVGAQRQRVGRRARRPRPETRPGSASTGFSKNSATVLPASASRPTPRSRPAFSSAARSSSASSSAAESSSPVRKCLGDPFKQGILWAHAALRALTWNLFHGRDRPPDPGPVHAGARGCCGTPSDNATHLQVNRDLYAEFAGVLARGRVGRRPAAGVPAAVGRAARRGDRRRAAPGAHLAQLARRAALDARAPQPRPDRLQRGRLEPHPGPRRGSLERRELVLAPGPQPGAPGDGVHAGAARRVRGRGLRRQPARQRRARPGARGPRRGPARRRTRGRVGRRRRRSSSAATSTCARARAPSSRASSASVGPREAPRPPDSLDHLLVARARRSPSRQPLAAGAPRGRRRRARDPALRPRARAAAFSRPTDSASREPRK